MVTRQLVTPERRAFTTERPPRWLTDDGKLSETMTGRPLEVTVAAEVP